MPRVEAVVATSEFVLASLGPRIHDVPTLVLENGVEYRRFVAGDVGPGAGAVYVGAIDQRFDWNSVIAMAESAPDTPFELFGPAAPATRPLPENVRLRGPVPYEALPGVLQRAAIGLLPLSSAEINNGRSPMKFNEYLAAGLRVAATHTPTLATRNAPGVALYHGPDDAADVTRRLLAEDGRNDEGARYAKEFDWAARARRLVDFLERS